MQHGEAASASSERMELVKCFEQLSNSCDKVLNLCKSKPWFPAEIRSLWSLNAKDRQMVVEAMDELCECADSHILDKTGGSKEHVTLCIEAARRILHDCKNFLTDKQKKEIASIAECYEDALKEHGYKSRLVPGEMVYFTSYWLPDFHEGHEIVNEANNLRHVMEKWFPVNGPGFLGFFGTYLWNKLEESQIPGTVLHPLLEEMKHVLTVGYAANKLKSLLSLENIWQAIWDTVLIDPFFDWLYPAVSCDII
jgi:hypothetical protein